MIRTKFLAVFSKQHKEGHGKMYSVAVAQELTRELATILAPEMPAKVKYDRLYRKMSVFLPDVTRRRIRALHNGEARRIEYEEMRALEEARADEELRRARRQIAEAADILAAHHAKAGAPLDSDTIAALRRLAGPMGLSRDGGAAR